MIIVAPAALLRSLAPPPHSSTSSFAPNPLFFFPLFVPPQLAISRKIDAQEHARMVEDTESRLETASSTARDSLKTMQSIEQSLVARLQRLDKELDAVRTTCSDNNSVADSKVRSVLVGGWALDRVLVPFVMALCCLRLFFFPRGSFLHAEASIVLPPLTLSRSLSLLHLNSSTAFGWRQSAWHNRPTRNFSTSGQRTTRAATCQTCLTPMSSCTTRTRTVGRPTPRPSQECATCPPPHALIFSLPPPNPLRRRPVLVGRQPPAVLAAQREAAQAQQAAAKHPRPRGGRSGR